MTILRDEKMVFVRHPNVARGSNLRTILDVVLKIKQRESAIYIDDHTCIQIAYIHVCNFVKI